MRIRVIKRYSECFKRQVVEELEQGRFGLQRPGGICHSLISRTILCRGFEPQGYLMLQ